MCSVWCTCAAALLCLLLADWMIESGSSGSEDVPQLCLGCKTIELQTGLGVHDLWRTDANKSARFLAFLTVHFLSGLAQDSNRCQHTVCARVCVCVLQPWHAKLALRVRIPAARPCSDSDRLNGNSASKQLARNHMCKQIKQHKTDKWTSASVYAASLVDNLFRLGCPIISSANCNHDNSIMSSCNWSHAHAHINAMYNFTTRDHSIVHLI